MEFTTEIFALKHDLHRSSSCLIIVLSENANRVWGEIVIELVKHSNVVSHVLPCHPSMLHAQSHAVKEKFTLVSKECIEMLGQFNKDTGNYIGGNIKEAIAARLQHMIAKLDHYSIKHDGNGYLEPETRVLRHANWQSHTFLELLDKLTHALPSNDFLRVLALPSF